jgi:glycosyltransferase involved in cell wall biosynthesis
MTNDQRPTTMRVAWFSPLPPVRSGIAAYSAEVLPHLAAHAAVDCFTESNAHDFVWSARRQPYDLIVYQLGNAPCHDYMWAYLAAYPGLVVLHDARLHHARARSLLHQRRFDDYRREFQYDHPDATPGFTEYAVEGLGGPIYYFWSMLRVVMRTARTVAVHNARVAEDLREQYPDAAVEVIRMGVPAIETTDAGRISARRALGLPDRAIVFAAFGKVTAEKRVVPILRALGALAAEGRDVRLLIVGDAEDSATLADAIVRLGVADRVAVAGHVADEAIGAHLVAADVCLCLRWPTAQETSASWLRCLAAARPTVISDLAHLVDIPTIDPRDWRTPEGSAEPVAVRIDLMDEEGSLAAAMRRLADDRPFRESLARAGRAHWAAHHTLEAMAADYQTVIAHAARRSTPVATDLPQHFTEDYTGTARAIARQFGVDLDILR